MLGAGALVLIAVAATACTSDPVGGPAPSGSAPAASEPATTSPTISTAPSAVPQTTAAASPAKHSAAVAKPSLTVYRCEGPAVVAPSWLNLACADQKMGIGQLRWSGWGEATAHATGSFWEYDCVPSCASSILISVPTAVTASGLVGGHYTRLHVTATPTPALPLDYRLTNTGPVAE
ncbi:hypothetical protein CU254_12555 [Amycolatopsis sp. AA4]|uniref:hypothetical protein n=1 Tax=Amycolatopsis sp. AA4 TaxID=1896961 RepID=UPI0001B56004|nr:hypothetical protein [Amycolatopsis sp. AA4]ATY11206.1 hypothetical protein CU254_12555 [Amycolatopsis sp. AA4]